MKLSMVAAVMTITILTTGMSAIAADVQPANEHKEPVEAEKTAQPMSSGEVIKIDKEQGKVTIKHGELKNLGMPAMTMNFRVKDPAMLDKLTVGQKINFIAEDLNGALTVVKLN